MSTLRFHRQLARLRAADRAWILERLSAAARMKLARGVGMDGPPELPYEPTGDAHDLRELAGRGAAEIVDALRGEPSWVIWIVLGAASWNWRAKVFKALPSAARLDIRALEREKIEIAPAVTQTLLRALAQRLNGAPEPANAPPAFEHLLQHAARGPA